METVLSARNVHNGHTLELRIGKYEGQCICAFVDVDTGELREQAVRDFNLWSKVWKRHAERHLINDDPSEITPLSIIPSARMPKEFS